MISNILITGATGTWGQELIRQLVNNYPEMKIYGVARNESKMVEAQRQFPKVTFIPCDVGDKDQVDAAFEVAKPQVVIHLAAMKQGRELLDPLHLPEEESKAGYHATMVQWSFLGM